MEEIASEKDEIDSALSTHSQNLLECLQGVLRTQRIFVAEAQVDVGSEENLEDILRTALRLGHGHYYRVIGKGVFFSLFY